METWISAPLFTKEPLPVLWVLGRGSVGAWVYENAFQNTNLKTSPDRLSLFSLQDLKSGKLIESYPLAPESPPLEIWVVFKAWQLNGCFNGLTEFLKSALNPIPKSPAPVPREIRITLFQNGLGIVDEILDFHLDFQRKLSEQLSRITNASTSNASTNPCVSFYRGFIWSGFRRMTADLSETPTLIGDVRFERVSVTQSPQSIILAKEMEWRKGLVNLVINPLGALYGVSNGNLLENSEWKNQAAKLCDCALRSAHNQGHLLSLSQSDAWKILEETCRKTAQNRNSFLQDLEAKRPTEWTYLLPQIAGKTGDSKCNHLVNEIIEKVELKFFKSPMTLL